MSETPTNWPWPTDTRGLWNRSILDRSVFERLRIERDQAIEAATAFRLAAEADGWASEPTYPGHEPMETAFRLRRDGLLLGGLARPTKSDEPPLGSGEICGWCDRGIGLRPIPLVYPGFVAIKALSRHCPECGADDVDTVRVAFANRACHNCEPELRKSLERPGWND